MKWIALVGLVVAGNCQALDLFCEGDAYVGSDRVAISFLLTLDQESMEVSSWTPSGTASGIASISREDYIGALNAPSGESYWFNLNRYDGSYLLMDNGDFNDKQAMKARFNGRCAKKSPLF